MTLILTKHARIRQQQRGFSRLMLELLEEFAKEKRAMGAATELFFGKKEALRALEECKRLIQLLDKVSGSSLIVKDGMVLTMYKN